jgi:formiminotetrahydrofolate cyclodeaminase
MADWPRVTLEDFAAALGDAGPVPAAGAASAAVCAFAAGLVQLALGADDPGAARAAELRVEALALMERDERAYAAFVESRGRGDPDELEARREASRPPLEMAEAAAEIAELADAAGSVAPPARRGDALAAGHLARGAGRAALALVDVNLEGAAEGEPLLSRAAQLADRLR